MVLPFALFFIQERGGQAFVNNPCYPRNHIVNLTMNHIFGSLCSAKFRPANYNPDQFVRFKGTGDPDQCLKRVSTLFNFTACHGEQDCSFNGIYQPNVKGKFSVRSIVMFFFFLRLIKSLQTI